MLFASDCKVGYNVVSEVLRALFKRGILDQSLYEQYGVLTSEGIQKRYLEMVKRRQDVRLDPRYALLLPIKNPVNVDINGVNADNNAGNVDGGTQRKGKENKNISINHHSAREEAKLRYMGGALGKGVVLLNTDQLDALLEDLSIEEFDKYVTIVADEELKGHHYRKPHYRAIMDMVEQDRRIGGVAG